MRSLEPTSRTVVKPAISVRRAYSVAMIACSGMGFFSQSSWSCFQSRLDSKLRWVWASIRPGSSVASPRSSTRAPAGTCALEPAATMRPSDTTTTPGVTTASAFPS